jgi:hypothetical protein
VPCLGETLRHPVRQPDRHGHQLRGLSCGVAEHDALIPGALTVEFVGRGAFARLEGVVDSLRDVGRLPPDRDGHAARAAVEPDVGRVVADVGDALTDDPGDVDVRRGGDLARDVDQPRRHQRLDGDPRVPVFGQQGIEDRIADLVADLVGMPLGHRFGGEQTEGIGHGGLHSGTISG